MPYSQQRGTRLGFLSDLGAAGGVAAMSLLKVFRNLKSMLTQYNTYGKKASKHLRRSTAPPDTKT
jgi:hypothetical protein